MSRQAYSLDVLLAEVNKHAPGRSKASDGGLGDPAHAARVSDHNPNAAGVWRARDFTDDPDGGCDGSDLFHRILNLMRDGHPALQSGAYLIHNRKIVSFDRLDDGLRDYDGVNAHLSHVHVSVSTAAAGYDNRTPWNLWATAPAKPTAPQTPTVADIVIALKRLLENSTNDIATKRYEDAIASLDNLVGTGRVRVPNGVAEIRTALRDKLDGHLTQDQTRGIRSALNLLDGI